MDRDGRDIDNEQAQKFVADNNLHYFETSAKSGLNVDEMFSSLAVNLPPPAENEESETFPVTAESPGESEGQSSCPAGV